jgi:hypothetical protein
MKSALVCIGAVLLASAVSLVETPAQVINPKLASVRKIFVESIDGNSGTLARNRLMALLTNSGRFEVVEDLKLADAVLKGLAETQDAGVAVTAQTGGRAGSGIMEGYDEGVRQRRERERIKGTLVIRLVLTTGKTVWAWDDTKICSKDSKFQCAVDDLLKQAKE